MTRAHDRQKTNATSAPAAVHVVRVDPQRLVHAPHPHLPPLRRRRREVEKRSDMISIVAIPGMEQLRETVTGHCSSAVCTRSRWGARNPFVLMSATTPPKCHRPVPRHPSHEPKGAKPHRSKLVSCRSKPSSSMAGSHGSVPHQGLYTQSQARGTRTCVGHVTALMP